MEIQFLLSTCSPLWFNVRSSLSLFIFLGCCHLCSLVSRVYLGMHEPTRDPRSWPGEIVIWDLSSEWWAPMRHRFSKPPNETTHPPPRCSFIKSSTWIQLRRLSPLWKWWRLLKLQFLKRKKKNSKIFSWVTWFYYYILISYFF